ncbi:MAG: hypothetical protein HYV75_05960 [Opitutae bacterium]|nr:hypothetical protein [Opitutae bacterium]
MLATFRLSRASSLPQNLIVLAGGVFLFKELRDRDKPPAMLGIVTLIVLTI